MAKHPSTPSQTPPEDAEHPEVYSINQGEDGSLHLSRRDFLSFGAVAGGVLLLKGVCPRFGANSASAQSVQAAAMPFPQVYLHAGPSIDSNIMGTLQQNDLVLLIGDHPDLGWMEVATRADLRGWLDRRFVDFSRAFTSTSRDFGLSSAPIPAPALTPAPTVHPIQASSEGIRQTNDAEAEQAQACGEIIQNGDFEAGHVAWVEDGSHGIITNTWATPYQGAWVALLGGVDYALDKLTQLFHVPADAQDGQTFTFYLRVTTTETPSDIVYDSLILRFLDASGMPISTDIPIADNRMPKDWSRTTVQLSGFSTLADRDVQVQFEGKTDSTSVTHFVIDSISLSLACGAAIPTPTQTGTAPETPTATPTTTPTTSAAPSYVYLPIVMTWPTAVPTITPTATPTATPCPSYNSCPSYNACPTNYCTVNSVCPPVNNCPLYHFCTCNTLPCTCNAHPCSCNTYFCSCNTLPCACNAHPCSCNTYFCSCNAYPCTCNVRPCSIT